ncbi:MAG: hypothetical protein Q8P15_03540 [Nanoarchaeota archaeon]|nr:hypothetical protein [Nanoarchaeota archaeon]
MKRGLINFVAASLITAGAIFLPNKVYSLEEAVKADSVGVKKESRITNLKLDGGGDFNDASNRGYFGSKLKLDKKLEFEFSYDYLGAKNIGDEYRKKEAKKKEKKLLIASVQYNVWNNIMVGLSYDSDNAVGIYSTLLSGGLNKKFSDGVLNGLYIDGYFAWETRKNLQNKKGDVIGFTLKYVMPPNYTNNFLNWDINTFCRLPKKYIRGGTLDGPMEGGLISALTIPIPKTKHFRFGVDFNLRRDHIPILNQSITRKGFSIRVSMDKKEKRK